MPAEARDRAARRAGIAVSVVAAVFLAACGDDEAEETTATATTAGQTEFARQADEICRQADLDTADAAREEFGGREPSPDDLERFAEETVIPSIQRQIDEISELTPPEGEEEPVSEFVDTATRELDELEHDPGILGAPQADEAFSETRTIARQLGITRCAEG